MPAAFVGAAASVVGALSSSEAASSAAGQQAAGQAQSLAFQQQMYGQSQQNLAPYLTGGGLANTELLTRLGLGGSPGGYTNSYSDPAWQKYIQQGGYTGDPTIGGAATDTPAWQAERNQIANTGAMDIDSNNPNYGSLLHQFDANDLTTNLAPNYAFMLDQGQQANKNAANLGGGLLGGNALQGLDTFTQNYAQNAYQQAYNNYNTNQNNIFTRLSGVAQTGQNSAVNAASNAINAGQSMGQTAANIGTAQAGGTIGSANALAGGLNNASSYYQLGQIMNGGGSGYVNNLSPAGGGYATGMADINSQVAGLP